MGFSISMRDGFDGTGFRQLARKWKEPGQTLPGPFSLSQLIISCRCRNQVIAALSP